MDYDGSVIVRDLDCFWCTACVNAIMTAPALVRGCSQSQSLLCHMAELSPDCHSPCPNVELHCEASRPWAVTWLRLGHMLGNHRRSASFLCYFNSPSLPCCRSKQACACSWWAGSKLPTALMLIPVPLHPTKRKSDPRTGTQCAAQIAYSPERVSTFVNPLRFWVHLPMVQVLTWSFLFPSYQISHGSFLQPWLYSSLPASLQLVSSEDFSMLICILDMFMGGSNFCVLLLCHPDLFLYT